jgi:hypothetical protein
MSFAIVAVIVVPFRFGGGTLDQGAAAPLGQSAPINLADRRVENAYIAAVRHASSTAGVNEEDKSTAFNRIYPDDIRPQRKEVGPAATTFRPSEAS